MNTKKIIITMGLILLSAAGLGGCGRGRELTELSAENTTQNLTVIPLPESDISTDEDSLESDAAKSPQLTALADTLEEAQEIADLYGIELESYSYGVAAYRTDKDIQELIDFGVENDYPTLSPNYKNQLHTAQ